MCKAAITDAAAKNDSNIGSSIPVNLHGTNTVENGWMNGC